MKVLLICDEPAIGLTLEAILKLNGLEVCYIPAPLVEERGSRGYAPEVAEHILASARKLAPDWVIMILQGPKSFGQMDVAIAIHKETLTARYLFLTVYDRKKEMDTARASGLDLRLAFMSLGTHDLLAVLEKPLSAK